MKKYLKPGIALCLMVILVMAVVPVWAIDSSENIVCQTYESNVYAFGATRKTGTSSPGGQAHGSNGSSSFSTLVAYVATSTHSGVSSTFVYVPAGYNRSGSAVTLTANAYYCIGLYFEYGYSSGSGTAVIS